MGLPKRRQSSSRRDKRRAQHKVLTASAVSKCSRCGAAKLPHHVCTSCGYYKDRAVLQIEEQHEEAAE
ncbi:MAG: 50S ribosomal protein L32 [Myxococcales bacterium]|nr:50S ribosomal protein L32 [Myxococcales bacterium]